MIIAFILNKMSISAVFSIIKSITHLKVKNEDSADSNENDRQFLYFYLFN